ACNGSEEKLDDLRSLVGKADGDPLRIVSVGAGAWGSVFAALLQDTFGQFRDKVQIRIWRRPGKTVDRATAKHLFEVINSREDLECLWRIYFILVVQILPQKSTTRSMPMLEYVELINGGNLWQSFYDNLILLSGTTVTLSPMKSWVA
ncbi:hypothetical protein V8G54_027763, partial [Vigna mungo]